MKLIGTSQPSAHFFLLIGAPILSSLIHLIRKVIAIEGSDHLSKPFIILANMFLGELLASIFLIHKLSFTKAQPIHNVQLSKIKFLANTKTTLNESFPYFIVALTGIIDFIATFGLLIGTSESEGKYREGELRIIQILFTVTVSYLFFRCLIYRHLILSIALIIIGSILLYFSDEGFRLEDLWFVFHFSLNSSKFLINKWVLEKRFTNPFKLISFEGLVGLSVTLLYITIGTFTCDFSLQLWYCESFDTFAILFEQAANIAYFMLFVILYCLLNSGYLLILKNYDPTLLSVTMSITNVLNLLFMLFQQNVPNNLEMYLIGNALILLGAVIYNEMVILYCFGLEQGTKTEIIKRSIKDITQVILNLSEDSNLSLVNSFDSPK